MPEDIAAAYSQTDVLIIGGGGAALRAALAACDADSFEAIAAHLPGETRAYVPKVMATVSLREDQLRGVPGSFWMPRGP